MNFSDERKNKGIRTAEARSACEVHASLKVLRTRDYCLFLVVGLSCMVCGSREGSDANASSDTDSIFYVDSNASSGFYADREATSGARRE